MASAYVIIDNKRYKRQKQGRKPSGLSEPVKVRLYVDDLPKLDEYAKRFGYYWNFNSYIRELVHRDLSNFAPTELVNT